MSKVPWTIASLAQLSVLLEVSSPKPGNVNRLRAFSDTGYRHFLASAALLGHGLYISAKRGVELVSGKIVPKEVKLGELILLCAQDVFGGLNRRNTILGTILLYIPVVVSSAAAIYETRLLHIPTLRKWITHVIDDTTTQDTLDLYKAFLLASPGGNRNREVQSWSEIHDRYDINNPDVLENIREDNVTLQELFKLSSDVESLSREWSTYFQLTLDEVFPYLDKMSSDLENLEEGVVRTFLWLLSKKPDGLIIKKVGLEKAIEVQRLAQQVMQESQDIDETSTLFKELDTILRSDGNRLNPGTTADMVSVAILLKLLQMTYR